MSTDPLQQLTERGQSVWLDFISRELVTTDQLLTFMTKSHVTGLTSNPTIFEKAMGHGSDYDEQIHELLDRGTTDANEIFLALEVGDIQHACDVMRPVWERTGGQDGFVSIEVSPLAAHDTAMTNEMVDMLWERVDRPNLMVKIPATPEGIPAIEQALTKGRNVNVTLIFALSAYEDVINAYISALETRNRLGQSLDVHGVASFFVSRVDTAVDKFIEDKLAKEPNNPELKQLMGKAAIANARLAYQLFEQRFGDSDPRWKPLAAAGAFVQRPLWASTSAKNPAYRDVLYAEALIGPNTVDTMPPATIDAFADHGVVSGDSAREDYAGQHQILERLAAVGIEIDTVTADLLSAGVTSFSDSYNQLIAAIAAKVGDFTAARRRNASFAMGDNTDAVMHALHAGVAENVTARIWARDADLWKPGDAAHAKIIGNRLGWLDVIQTMRAALPRLLELSTTVLEEHIRDVVLLGMGGSSLCPEVLRTSFGSAAGYPTMHVLDTTDPLTISKLSDSIDPSSSLFLVASKSGGTLETLSHFAYFWKVVGDAGVDNPGQHFIAITDPGSPLAQLATEHNFREIFENPADIGGRYSALSFFGLVAAALLGADVEELLDRGDKMRASCSSNTPEEQNGGLFLGTAIAHFQAQGRDKVTIVAPPSIAAFSLWAEQLIAESTGKEGKGVIPIGAEPLGDPSAYGNDRLFVVLRLGAGDADIDAFAAGLVATNQPVVTLQLDDLYDLAAEFFRWEFATAVVGAALQIDPFDEPNVKESKDNTSAVLATYQSEGKLPAEPTGTEDQLRHLLASSSGGDYVAVMAYIAPSSENEQALQNFRAAIRDQLRLATTLGFGPRFLHSTGQLHKGGPNTGIYIQFTSDDSTDVAIPGKPFSFSILKQAQAVGDLQSLQTHGRRVIHLHLPSSLTEGLAQLTRAVAATTTGAIR